MTKSNIGVCTAHKGGTIPWLFFWANIRIAGGVPIRITPYRPVPIDTLDGLIVAGGADISPTLYLKNDQPPVPDAAKKESPRRSSFSILLRTAVGLITFALRWIFGLKQAPTEAAKRDRLETRLITEAIQKGIPIMGVCRGMQLINVVKGGTLHQEIADVYEDVSHPYTVLPHKEITVQEGTKLHAIIRRRNIHVNALHHQAIYTLGNSLQITATDSSGIVEAIESTDSSFILGVQWHPEFLIASKSQRSIFRAFVSAASGGSSAPFGKGL